MDIRDAVATRYSCRAFLAKPVQESLIREIIARASRAPSAGNLHPWHVYVIAGRKLEELKTMLAARSGELPKGEGAEYQIYPAPLLEPYKGRTYLVGELLYNAINVRREDKAARYRQYARNFQFFGAPVGLFFARQKDHGPAQWADIGGYLQTVMLLARAYDLDTCPQQAWIFFHKSIREFLHLPANLTIYSGMAMGYADVSAAINQWRSPRAAVKEIATFDGFD